MGPGQLTRLPAAGAGRALARRCGHVGGAGHVGRGNGRGELDSSTGRVMTWTDGIAILPMLAVIGRRLDRDGAGPRTILGARWHVSTIVIGTFRGWRR